MIRHVTLATAVAVLLAPHASADTTVLHSDGLIEWGVNNDGVRLDGPVNGFWDGAVDATTLIRTLELRKTGQLLPGQSESWGWAAFSNQTGTMFWDPAVDGAVASIQISYDAHAVASGLPGGFTNAQVGIALLQDGIVYEGANRTSPNLTGNPFPNELNRVSFTPHDAASFTDVLGNTPDFSEAGSRIYFGITFREELTSPFANTIFPDFVGRFREYSAAVTIVPGPGSIAVLGLGGVIAVRRRR